MYNTIYFLIALRQLICLEGKPLTEKGLFLACGLSALKQEQVLREIDRGHNT